MSRTQVILDIEEADLRLLQYPEGVILPTRVIKLRKIAPDTYKLAHATNEDCEDHAIQYTRDPNGEYS